MDRANRAAEVPVPIDVFGLVLTLVGPSTEEQRYDWARYLLIQAHLSDGDLRYLFHALHDKGPRGQRELRQLSRGALADPSRNQIAKEREELASDMADIVAQLSRKKLNVGGFDSDVKCPSDEAPSKLSESFDGLHDILRRATASSAPRHAPLQTQQAFSADSLQLCRPAWQEGMDPKLAQAMLRFEPPGVEAGEKVLVDGPAGEQITLIVPSGIMHVQRALACVNRGELSKMDNFLQLDIVPLAMTVVPGGPIEISGITLRLPSSAVPGSSICVALPMKDRPCT